MKSVSIARRQRVDGGTLERFPNEGFGRLRQTVIRCEIRYREDGGAERHMPGLKQFWYPWPYLEGLTIEEATNELAFIATGMYGKPIPRQNGAPLRLAVPWKYGFKNIKSLVSFTFTDTQPVSYWEKVAKREYGFWANVNPKVDHPRWSQASERVLGGGQKRVPTLL